MSFFELAMLNGIGSRSILVERLPSKGYGHAGEMGLINVEKDVRLRGVVIQVAK